MNTPTRSSRRPGEHSTLVETFYTPSSPAAPRIASGSVVAEQRFQEPKNSVNAAVVRGCLRERPGLEKRSWRRLLATG